MNLHDEGLPANYGEWSELKWCLRLTGPEGLGTEPQTVPIDRFSTALRAIARVLTIAYCACDRNGRLATLFDATDRY